MPAPGAPGAPGGAPAPLTGRTVVVTRAETRSSPLTDRLEALGAEVVVAPCIATEAPSDGGAALSDAIARLDDAAVIALTSPTGARRLLAALAEAGLDGAALDGTTVAAVGPGTASVLSAAGVRVDVVPDDHVGEGLLDALGEPPYPGARVVLARAEVAREVLPDGLRSRGWVVDVVAAHRTVTPPPDPGLADVVAGADAVTFTSSSTVTGFLARFGRDALPPRVICIGPIAAGTAEAAGVEVDAVARPHSLEGLLRAVVNVLG